MTFNQIQGTIDFAIERLNKDDLGQVREKGLAFTTRSWTDDGKNSEGEEIEERRESRAERLVRWRNTGQKEVHS